MQIANYNNAQTPEGGVGKYPLSTQALDFIQQQILLLQQIALIGGDNYILRAPTGGKTGIIVINGEVLVLAATPILSNQITYVTVTTTTTNIDADGETYTGARTVRTAALASTKSAGECYAINLFTIIDTNATLANNIKSMPSTVLTYLSDILAEKLPSLKKTSMMQSMIDALKTPCLINCINSIKINDAIDYSIMVKSIGETKILQEQKLITNQKFTRVYDGKSWSEWIAVSDNLHIEVKIIRGTVFIRHGALPDDTKIILLRKKKRSPYRRTGGNNAYAINKGRRERRSPKAQYVHYKGVVLSKGKPNEWYIPLCMSVINPSVDSNIIGKDIREVCKSLVYQKQNDVDGNPVYRIQGVRNKIGVTNGKYKQHHGYAQIAIQAAKYNSDGGKNQGGEMIKMRYRLCRKMRIYQPLGQTYTVREYVYYRTISME